MDKLKETLKKIEKIDYSLNQATQDALDNLTKPQGSLGRLEELAKTVVMITRNARPVIKNKAIFVMAGDHGITDEGVSAYPKEVTAQMVYNFLREGAAINVLAKHAGARVIVIDMGVAEKIKIQKSKIKNFRNRKIGFGTKNFAKGPAMTRDEAVKSLESGIEIFEEEWKKGVDIIGTGDMGIGNTTPSSAITAVFTGKPIEEITGRGTGIDDSGLSRKVGAIRKGIDLNRPDPKDAIDVLSKVGGFEIGGLAGLMLGAASRRTPVMIDGFISGAAALIAYKVEPKVKDYLIASHLSVEKGHKIILDYIGLKPLLDLKMRLGEGTGAALGISLAEAAVKILTNMATFEKAAVSGKRNL